MLARSGACCRAVLGASAVTDALLEARNASRTFTVRPRGIFGPSRPLRAVENVTLAVNPGETVALVGESGSGKSTLGRMLLGLLSPTSGAIYYDGQPLTTVQPGFRRAVQAVFQDTSASLNPRRPVGASLEVPFQYNRHLSTSESRQAAAALLDRVGLPPDRFYTRFPHELSGGQRQRVCVARAFASGPRVVIADEPVSALDVSVRAQVLDLMRSLQRDADLAYLFITHDLGVVRAVATRVEVMYLGSIVERGPVDAIFRAPGHPYTRALLAATPIPDPARRSIALGTPVRGEIPSPLNPPHGCHFHPRCPHAQFICQDQAPPMVAFDDGVEAACHFAAEIRALSGGNPSHADFR